MTVVRHPTLDASYEVADSAVERWEAAGWIADRPEVPEPLTEQSGAASKARRTRRK